MRCARSPQAFKQLFKPLPKIIQYPIWLAFAVILSVIIGHFSIAANPIPNWSATNLPPNSARLEQIQPKTHSLPATLAEWQDASGDYFSEIPQLDRVGYLIWSQFPVTVYIQQPETEQLETFAGKALQNWANLVLPAVAEWSIYLPLEVVANPEIADIQIWRRRPPLRLDDTGELLPARSAETHYELYVRESDRSPAVLRHQCLIFLSPTQTGDYIQAAARHELGHALGIWGHSPVKTDVMYAAQVRYPPTISPRDVNTLQLVYQQPTLLGFPVDY